MITETSTSNKVSDTALAKMSTNIDLILGGHTHTFLEFSTRRNEPKRERNIYQSDGLGRHKLGTQLIMRTNSPKAATRTTDTIHMLNIS